MIWENIFWYCFRVLVVVLFSVSLNNYKISPLLFFSFQRFIYTSTKEKNWKQENKHGSVWRYCDLLVKTENENHVWHYFLWSTNPWVLWLVSLFNQDYVFSTSTNKSSMLCAYPSHQKNQFQVFQSHILSLFLLPYPKPYNFNTFLISHIQE